MDTMNSACGGISLCMIVKDEQGFLDAALRSVAGVVDEICIVDTGSTDRTLEIAHAHGARVVSVGWEDDFAHARNAALALATRRWIFVLDADERLAAESRAALVAIGHTPANGRGKWIMCRNLTDDCNGSGQLSNALVRIFPNDPRIRYRNPIHEFVALDGSDGGLPADVTAIEIVHHGYLGAVLRERNKAERNLRLSRRAAERDPGDAFHQYNLGMASLLAGNPDEAMTALDSMRELTRTTPRGYRVHGLIVLAELYAEHRGDLASGLMHARECLRFVPDYSNAHFVHGKLLARSGDLYAARNAYGRAISVAEHDDKHFVVDNEIGVWKAHSEIGATLMHERRYDEALLWFELAAQARPAVESLMLNRAKCHAALGDPAAAAALYATAFAAFSDETTAIEWINCLFRAERPVEALAAIERALPGMSEQCRALLLGTAAASHLRCGNEISARATIERALDCGERTVVLATLKTLALHLSMPGLAALLPAAPALRANELRIAYVS